MKEIKTVLTAGFGAVLPYLSIQAGIQKPNFIFLFADDLGWGDLGCYGNRQIKTPNIDSLAREGTLFTQGYASASVCSPSRAACLTGLFPARADIHGHFEASKNAARGMPDSLNPELPFLPQILQSAGYKTAHFGKWHLGIEDASLYGFDVAKTTNGGGKDRYKMPNGFDCFFRDSSEVCVNDSITFLEENHARPFYLQLWFLEPHAPNLPHEQFIKLYKEPGGIPEELIIPDPLIRYRAVVSNMDYHIGRLMKKLDELGLRENTIIVLLSDNGPEDHHISGKANTLGMGEPGPFRGRKRSLYEGGVRVPFIVRWPGVTPEGKVDNDSIVGCIDLFPTFAALAGVDISGIELDGQDITPALRGQPFERTKPLLWEWRYEIKGYTVNISPTHAVRLGKWKFYINCDGSRKELYDVQNSHLETDNLARQYPEIVSRKEKIIIDWRSTIPEWSGDADAGKQDYPWPE
ncbi:MAG: sulfatase-like hydrolase/transferase [Kiritimatiellales bacterium]